MGQPKFCKDCKFFYTEKEDPDPNDPFCMRPVKIDPVLGEDMPLNRHCFQERKSNGVAKSCGPEGIFWVLDDE